MAVVRVALREEKTEARPVEATAVAAKVAVVTAEVRVEVKVVVYSHHHMHSTQWTRCCYC